MYCRPIHLENEFPTKPDQTTNLKITREHNLCIKIHHQYNYMTLSTFVTRIYLSHVSPTVMGGKDDKLQYHAKKRETESTN